MRSKARIDAFGEVFTPPALVSEMLSCLPQEVWSDFSKTFCDPACGNGNFLVEVIGLKITAGSSPLQSLQTTFGIDILADNVAECRKRLIKQAELSSGQHRTSDWAHVVIKNVVCANALTYDFEFDDPKPTTPTQ